MQIIDLDEQASQEEFSRLVGVSQSQISRRIERGQLQPGGTCAEWLLAYCGALRDAASGRSESDEKREKVRLENQVKRIQLAKLRGELVDMAGVERGSRAMGRTLRDALVDKLPAILAQELAGLTDSWAVEQRLRSAIRDELHAIVIGVGDKIRADDPGLVAGLADDQ